MKYLKFLVGILFCTMLLFSGDSSDVFIIIANNAPVISNTEFNLQKTMNDNLNGTVKFTVTDYDGSQEINVSKTHVAFKDNNNLNDETNTYDLECIVIGRTGTNIYFSCDCHVPYKDEWDLIIHAEDNLGAGINESLKYIYTSVLSAQDNQTTPSGLIAFTPEEANEQKQNENDINIIEQIFSVLDGFFAWFR